MLDIQINNINKSSFSLKRYDEEVLHIANSNQYHIILFSKNCECEVNFKPCKVKNTQVLFLNDSDAFICKTKGNIVSRFSFDYKVFDKDHCETERLINGLLFDSLLNCNLLTFNAEEFLKFKLQLDKIISFQNKENFKKLSLVFKEIITQTIAKKHKQLFSEQEISKGHQTVYKYLSLLNEHFKIEHNVFKYAQILRVQPKFLTKVFFDLKIENPKHFLNQRILIASKNLLTYTTDTATSISYDIGFNEPAYFNRFFKKNTGLTTKEFRAYKSAT